MQKWQYSAIASNNTGASIAGKTSKGLWRKKNRDGKTDWDIIREMGQDGWELISATPITFGGTTLEVLFTFKRPIEG